MTGITDYDLIILGAGIAGLSLADACMHSGFTCAVIDHQKTGMGASGVTTGLLNPATGRKASKSWQADAAIPCTINLLERVHTGTGQSFYENNGVIRPALDDDIAENMKSSIQQNNWPEGWVHWMDKQTLQKQFPGLNCVGGGVWIPVACTVSLAKCVKALQSYLSNHGVDFYTEARYDITDKKPWSISLNQHKIRSRYLIQCTGSAIVKDPAWSFLPLHTVKGQILNLTLNKPFPLSASVSSLGYIANMTDNPHHITIGSTYEHTFKDEEPDKKAADYLITRHEKTIKTLQEQINQYQGWAGVRVTSPDRKPVVGVHPEIDNLFLLNALGSKGLAHGPYAATILANHLAYDRPIPDEINLSRFI